MKDTGKPADSWFGWDKGQHLLLFLWLGFCLSKFMTPGLTIVVCMAVGLAIEWVETLPVWARIMKRMGENEGTAPISWRDLVVDFVGTVAGIIAWLCR